MRINVAVKPYRLAFKQALRTAHGVWATREGFWLRLEDESGRVGFGEAAPVVGFGSDNLASVGEQLRRLGSDATEVQLATLAAAGGCVGFAVAGALAEMAGEADAITRPDYLSVATLLPAGVDCLRAVRPRVEMGFRTFKWKVGVGDPADERGLLDDLLAELPEGSRLRLDANGAWERRQAEAWLGLCAEREMIDYVEQPLAADLRGTEDWLMGLAGDYPTPIALDESIVGEKDLEHWVGLGWPGVYVLKPALWGDATRLIERVQKDQLDVVISTALETAIGAKAVLRTAFLLGGQGRPLGTGVWPLFPESWANGPTATPFVRWREVETMNPPSVWESAP